MGGPADQFGYDSRCSDWYSTTAIRIDQPHENPWMRQNLAHCAAKKTVLSSVMVAIVVLLGAAS
jgi:hypothetical protein